MTSAQFVKIIMEILFIITPEEGHCLNFLFCLEVDDSDKIYKILIFFGLLIFTISIFWFKKDSIFECRREEQRDNREEERQNRTIIEQNQKQNEQLPKIIQINQNHRELSNNLNE